MKVIDLKEYHKKKKLNKLKTRFGYTFLCIVYITFLALGAYNEAELYDDQSSNIYNGL